MPKIAIIDQWITETECQPSLSGSNRLGKQSLFIYTYYIFQLAVVIVSFQTVSVDCGVSDPEFAGFSLDHLCWAAFAGYWRVPRELGVTKEGKA